MEMLGIKSNIEIMVPGEHQYVQQHILKSLFAIEPSGDLSGDLSSSWSSSFRTF